MSGFDSSYYDNHLKSLYETSGVYNVDPLIFSLRDEVKINQMIKSDSYFKTINSITFKSDNKDSVLARMVENEDTVNLNTIQPVGETADTVTYTKLTGDASKEYVSVNINRTSQDVLAVTILEAIKKDTAVSNSGQGSDVDAVTRNHKIMSDYIDTIVLSVGKYFFKQSKIIISGQQNPQTGNAWSEGRQSFMYLSDSKTEMLVGRINEVCKDVLYKIIKGKAEKNLEFNAKSSTTEQQKQYIRTNFMEDIQIGNFKGPLYYRLRTEIINRLVIPKSVYTTDNTNELLYFKMIAVDIYMKTCYPAITLDYISSMLKLYVSYGDFINSRIALLVKVMFTYTFVTNIALLYNSTPGHQNATYNQQITSVVNKLKMYLDNVNKIDMENGSADMLSDIIKKLHVDSKQVVTKNELIQKLQKDIKNNQLAMRNVLFNIEELRKMYKMKLAMLIVFAVLLLLIILVSVALLLISDTFKPIVVYIAGGVSIIILIYEISRMLIKIISSGKKSS